MKYTAILLLAVLCLSGCSQKQNSTSATSSPQQSTKPSKNVKLLPSFKDADSGLTADAPDGWGFLPKDQVEYVNAQCLPQDSKGDLPVILIQMDDIQTDLTFDQIVSNYSKQIAKGIDNPKITKDESIKDGINGAEAYEVVVNGKLKGQPVTSTQTLLKKDKFFIVVTQMCRQINYEKLQPVFEKFSRGLKFQTRS